MNDLVSQSNDTSSSTTEVDYRWGYIRWFKLAISSAAILYLFLSLSANGSHLVGWFGVSLRQELLYWFGGSAWLLPVAGLYMQLERMFVPKGLRLEQPFWCSIVGWVLLGISLSTLVLLTDIKGSNVGIVAQVLLQIAQGAIGSVGSTLVFMLIALLGLALIASVRWLRVFYLTGNWLLQRVWWVDVAESKPDDEAMDVHASVVSQQPQQDDALTNGQRSIATSLLDNAPVDEPADASLNVETTTNAAAITKTAQSPQQEVLQHQPPPRQWLKTLAPSQSLIVKAGATAETAMVGLPPLSLLNSKVGVVKGFSAEQLNAMGRMLEENLQHFNIKATVQNIQPGPVVTLFEIAPAPGVKVGQIVQLGKDLARALSVKSVRIVEVIPGKPYIGVEIPNQQRETVNFYELLASKSFQQQQEPLTMALGKDIGGAPVVINLAKTPHLLVAGTTGSGKSVGINSMILSLLYKSLPEVVKLILIDPKMLELSVYEGIPHLLTPVVTDVNNAASALKWSVAEMERRYKLMSLLGVRNIIGFNDKLVAAKKQGTPIKDPLHKPLNAGLGLAEEAPELEPLSYIVVVIDEFADLIMVVGKQVEELIARLAQKARAAGIHLVLATQRPSVNVITGLIKANVPSRLSFQVSTKIDSRTILDQGGAEQLLGLGDMLYLEPGKGLPIRAHGAFVSDAEVHATVEWLKQHHQSPNYIDNFSQQADQSFQQLDAAMDGGDDELFEQAWQCVSDTGKVSISRIQRELRIGYNRAARLVEDMQTKGWVSSPDDRGVRQILVANNATHEVNDDAI